MLSRNLLTVITVLLSVLLTVSQTHAQSGRNPEREAIRTPWHINMQPEWLNQVMPQAETFSEKTGEPPVYRGYRQNADTGEQELVGYAFLSMDLPPEEVGYSAPIAMLIGLLADGTLSGIKVLTYFESFAYSRGDFVADVEFQSQFPGKAISDDFRLTQDIDGLVSATMTSFAITRGVRNAARQVANAYMGLEFGDQQAITWGENAVEHLSKMSWQEMLDAGIVKTMTMPTPSGTDLELTFTYIGRPALGKFFIGEEYYARAERDASRRLGGQEMILVAVGGEGAPLFRQNLLSFQQGEGEERTIQPRRFVTAGNADEAMLAGHAEYAGAFVMEEYMDPTQPFTLSYKPQGSLESYSVEYTLSGVGLALARNEPVLSQAEIDAALLAEAPFYVRLRHDPPWGETPWPQVIMLLVVFALVMTAFLRKSANIRWAALTVTLFYLGFFQGGFLSVSHITNAMKQGPDIFLTNLPVLMIVTFTVVTTLLWGRIFCSSLCPFGALQDFIARFRPKRWKLKVPQRIHENALYIKYGILALILGLTVVNPMLSIFQYFEPFGTLFFFSPSIVLWVILVAILVGCALIERFYCRYVCPLGAALGVVSMISPLRIKRVPQCTLCTVCEHACPTGAIKREKIDFKECVRCDVCETKLIVKAGTCRHDVKDIIVKHRELGDKLGTGKSAAGTAVPA